jgi:hypothetical protein
MVENGGCVADVLVRIGVISKDVEVVKLALNSCIRPSYIPMRKGWIKGRTRVHPMSFAGIPDQEWHINVIKLAMFRYDNRHYLEKAMVDGGGCAALLPASGIFFIDGTLNKQFMRLGKDYKAMGEIFQHEGHSDINRSNDSKWRHAIAAKDRQIFCPNLSNGGVTIANLWLNPRGVPCRTKGYMKEFIKVYRLMPKQNGWKPSIERTTDYKGPLPKRQRVK